MYPTCFLDPEQKEDLRIWNSTQRLLDSQIKEAKILLPRGKHFKINTEKLNEAWGVSNMPELRQDILDSYSSERITLLDNKIYYYSDNFHFMNIYESLDDWCKWHEIPHDCLYPIE